MSDSTGIIYSVIIPTLNHSSKLNQCLFYLSELSFKPDLFEVLVIDNGSTDDTKEVSLSYNDKIRNLRYIFCRSPGLMAARHMGCDKAKGKILCYLDDDSLVDKSWLQGISDAFCDEEVAIAGGPCIPEYEVMPPNWVEYFWSLTEYGKVNGFLSLIDFGDKMLNINPIYIFGCNYSIRKKILLDYGGTNPDYMPEKYSQFLGDGESGLSMKIADSKYKTIYDPRIKIRHLIPASRLTVEYFCWRRYYNGVHTSYIAIRREHGFNSEDRNEPKFVTQELAIPSKVSQLVKRKLKAIKRFIFQAEPGEVRRIRKEIRKSFEKGFRFHQEAVKKDPKLLEWVLRKNYLGENGKLPE